MKKIMFAVAIHLILVGCSKSEKTDADAQADTSTGDRVAYVSEQEQYVKSLHEEVSIDDPDALLDDLNQNSGDNSENAALVSQKSLEGAPLVQPTKPDPKDEKSEDKEQ